MFTVKWTCHYLNKSYYSLPYVDTHTCIHLYTQSIFYRWTPCREADDIVTAQQLIMPLAL
jgi:hypothetical protein